MTKFFTLSLAAVLMLTGGMASAQNQMQTKMQELAQTTPDQRAELQTSMMKTKLSLTDQQLPEVQKINLDTATQMQPVIAGSDGPLIKMRKAKTIEAQRDTALQKVLTPDQYKQWQAEKEQMKQQIQTKLAEQHASGTSN